MCKCVDEAVTRFCDGEKESLWLLSQTKLPLGAQPHRVIYCKCPAKHTAKAKTKRSEWAGTHPTITVQDGIQAWNPGKLRRQRTSFSSYLSKHHARCTVLISEKQKESFCHHGAWAALRGPRHSFLEGLLGTLRVYRSGKSEVVRPHESTDRQATAWEHNRFIRRQRAHAACLETLKFSSSC